MLRLNGVDIPITHFPNGEIGIATGLDSAYIRGATDPMNHAYQTRTHAVNFSFLTNDDLIALVFLKSHMDENLLNPADVVDLFISYMPYSRMDRGGGEYAFSLRYAARIINSLGFRRVFVREPHSDVSLALLDRSAPQWWTSLHIPAVKRAIGFVTGEDYIVYPDAGAQKRYTNVEDKVLTGIKHRNFASGNIESLRIEGMGEGDIASTRALIVDDLCSRGGTFVRCAERLKDYMGFKEVYLLVTHLEDNVYTGDLFDYVDGVYASDSIASPAENEKVHIIT